MKPKTTDNIYLKQQPKWGMNTDTNTVTHTYTQRKIWLVLSFELLKLILMYKSSRNFNKE